jgi:glutamine synthetase
VPTGPPASRHVEHRVAGADANPYLVAALVLAGMLHGIERQLDPGPPVLGNGYAAGTPGELPLQWSAALERAASSPFVRDALGAGFLDVFLAIKRQESEKFGSLVTDRDYEWYLDTT